MGSTGAAALTDDRIAGWRPDVGVLVGALTLLIVLLVARALDDIRDLAYDRVHNPDRPLAAGVVSVRDLVGLVAVGSAAALALNAWRWPVACVLAALLGYSALAVWVECRFGWPRGDALLLGIVVNLPVQVLTNGFLYAGLLWSLGLGPVWSGALGGVAAILAFFHLEFARKTTRAPRPGERTYVHVLGVTGTAAAAVGCAVAAVVLVVAAARPGTPLLVLTALPLVLVALAAARMRGGAPRWPYGPAAGFLLACYLAFALVAVAEGVGA